MSNKKFYKSKLIVDLLLERESNGRKQVLLFLAGYEGNRYDLPGGHVEENENIYFSACREANEELGINVKKENLELVHIHHHYKNNEMHFVFKIKEYEGIITNKEFYKHEKMEWHDVDNLPENTILGIRKEIIDIYNGILHDADEME